MVRILLLLLAGFCVCLPLKAALPDGYTSVFVEAEASGELTSAANVLASLLEKTYGQSPRIQTGSASRDHPGLYLGTFETFSPVPGHPTDRIRISRTGNGLEIRGMDETAACFAVFRFLEEFLGWRMYQPGALGYERLDDPPVPPPVFGDPEILLEESAGYFSRTLHGLGNDPDTRTWELWHGLRERFSFNHSLHRIITPDFFEEHPDWFAKDAKGRPKRPPYQTSRGTNDHPDLSNEGLRAYAADKYLEALRGSEGKNLEPVMRSPGTLSISLSLADSYKFGHFDDDYRWLPKGYFRRWPNWSNHVFDYTNAVARDISRQFESDGVTLYLGALAYLSWECPPDFPVHPSVLPYLTYDRSQWYSKQSRTEDLANVSRWGQTGVRFTGTWDYLFSEGFLFPRSLSNIVSDSIPALHERGVRAYFSQIGAIWPYDRHTNWLATRLLWNPEADPDALLHEFFREFYGPAAAPMRSFFDKAESIWMRQSGAGSWLRYWRDPWQVAIWNREDLLEMEGLLEEALEQCRQTPVPEASGLSAVRFHSRIREVVQLFELSRLHFNYQEACWKLQSIGWEETRPDQWAAAREHLESAERLRDALQKRFEETLPGRNSNWVFKYDPIEAICATLDLQKAPANKIRQVLFDRSLEKVDDGRIWGRHALDSDQLSMDPLPGKKGFFIENARRAHIYQLFAVKAGDRYLAMVDLYSKQSASADINVRMEFYDEHRNLLGTSSYGRMTPSSRIPGTQRLRASGTAPEGTGLARLVIRFYEMDPASRAEVYAAQVMNLGPAESP